MRYIIATVLFIISSSLILVVPFITSFIVYKISGDEDWNPFQSDLGAHEIIGQWLLGLVVSLFTIGIVSVCSSVIYEIANSNIIIHISNIIIRGE